MNITGRILFLLLMWNISVAADDTTQEAPPIYLSADKGIEIHDQENYVHAKENISVERGATTLYGDECKAYYDKDTAQDDKRDLTKIDVHRNVLIFSPEGTIYADEGTYDIPKDTVTLTGKALRLQGGAGNLYAKDTLLYHPEQRQAEALGDAHIISRDKTQHLFADRLVSNFIELQINAASSKTSAAPTPDGLGNNLALDSIEAFGNVRIILPNKVVMADHGKYIAAADKFILTHNVKLQEEDKQMQGDYAVIDRKTGLSKVWYKSPAEDTSRPTKRVRALLLPKKKKV